MTTNELQMQEQLKEKAIELGLWEDALVWALHILSQNKDFVNALDNRTEMDEYIYRGIIKNATDKRRRQAELEIENPDTEIREKALKDLTILSREEIITDPYYRAILPVIARVVVNEPILRLHADEASEIILKLADFKRKHRVTTVTEVIVTKCKEELNSFGQSVLFS